MSRNLPRKLTADQLKLVKEMCEAHGLDADQISFEGEEITPIFNFEALSALSVKLTDIQDIETRISEENEDSVTAICVVTLPDGRTRTVEESAAISEVFGDGFEILTKRLAGQVAMARATRRGIRAVGVNLYNAHKKFMETGEIQSGHTNHDPRYTHYQEINALAYKLGLKKKLPNLEGKHTEDRTQYDALIAENFEGKTSATELDDLELQRFKTMLRSVARIPSVNFAADKAA